MTSCIFANRKEREHSKNKATVPDEPVVLKKVTVKGAQILVVAHAEARVVETKK
jgi:hypothetical protein